MEVPAWRKDNSAGQLREWKALLQEQRMLGDLEDKSQGVQHLSARAEIEAPGDEQQQHERGLGAEL